ncbi:AGE family epimerase/isomerase [Spirochaeta dissipatitropha]
MLISPVNLEKLYSLRKSAEQELLQNIHPYWPKHAMDLENGGFRGAISHDNVPVSDAAKGVVMHGRFAWLYSICYRKYGDSVSFQMAEHAVRFLEKAYIDREYGGVYWQTRADGSPLDQRKHFYGMAFALYGLSEFAHISSEPVRYVKLCEALFENLQKYGLDPLHGGYFEARSREWKKLDDTRLSPKDLNCAKSMNTNLHVLEALTNYYRLNPSARVFDAIHELVQVTVEHILDRETGHLKLYFDEAWNSLLDVVSYGHDIEAAWLLWEAVEIIHDKELMESIRPHIMKIAEITYSEAFRSSHGGVINELHGSDLDTSLVWWVQAESVVGFLNAYELSGDQKFLDSAVQVWAVIQDHIVDREHGEWRSIVRDDGSSDLKEDKGGIWKTPYHNGRACLEIISRIDRLII